MKLRFHIINAPDDTEKLILPGIIYCQEKQEGWTGRAVSIGWWHWGVGVILVNQ